MVHSFPTRRSSDLPTTRSTSTTWPRTSSRSWSEGRSEEHTSELQSHHPISYAVFCLKKKNRQRVPAIRDFLDLGDAVVAPLPLEGGVGDRPGDRVILLPVDDHFFFNDTATTEIYTGWYTLSLHDALPIAGDRVQIGQHLVHAAVLLV